MRTATCTRAPCIPRASHTGLYCRCLRRLVGHTREVKGLAIAPDGDTAVSCSADCTVKLWKVPEPTFAPVDAQRDARPVVDLVGQHAFLGVDYHQQEHKFATCGHAVDIWDAEHSEPVQTFQWDSDSTYSVRFNPVRSATPRTVPHLPPFAAPRPTQAPRTRC